MKKILLLICLIAILLVVGCTLDKTAKKPVKTTSPAISGAATTTAPKVVKTTPEKTSAVTPTVITSDKPTDSKVVEIKSTETKKTSTVVATGTINNLGKKGFEPSKTTVKKGDSLTFVNKQERNSVITLQNKATGNVFNSNQIPPGKTYTHTFDEAGDYKFWDVGMGIRGTVLVK